jgi:hypothetical protein
MQLGQLKRREFIALAGGTAVAWPLTARAQQPDRVKHISVLSVGDYRKLKDYLAAFQRGLELAGWSEGLELAGIQKPPRIQSGSSDSRAVPQEQPELCIGPLAVQKSDAVGAAFRTALTLAADSGSSDRARVRCEGSPKSPSIGPARRRN